MRPRLHALTTLRFFAALHVVLFHMRVVGILPGGPWWYQNFSSIGFVGVNFFFVLSGFLITGILLDSKNKTGYYRRFYIRRALRILPAFLSLTHTSVVATQDRPFRGTTGRLAIPVVELLLSCERG